MNEATYASGTKVSVEKSRAELDRLLSKHGATSRAMVNTPGHVSIEFVLEGVRFRLDVPMIQEDRVRPSREKKIPEPRDWWRWSGTQRDAWVAKQLEQKERERWRALVLVCKAKLEFVAMGLTTARREFMADLVLTGGERLEEAFEHVLANPSYALAHVKSPLALSPAGG